MSEELITMEDRTGLPRREEEIKGAIIAVENMLVNGIPPPQLIPLFMSLSTIRDSLNELLARRAVD